MLAVDATPRNERNARKKAGYGSTAPRVAPPSPARSDWRAFSDLAESIGWPLFPWQQTAAKYLTAKRPDGRLLWPEVAVVVGRQNGKTTLLLPLVISRMLAGRRVMHTAQNRSLPRDFFDILTATIEKYYKAELRPKRGISFGAGTENIKFQNGGSYRIVAPTKGGARGPSNDLVIIDELREMEDLDFIAAAEPTLSASPDPQMVYLSNAGTATSVVLNGLRDRAETDPAVCYLEWSADPERADDDVAGWLEANPGVGYLPGKMDYLRRKYLSYRLLSQMSLFETEHLCRWVASVRQSFVNDDKWQAGHRTLGKPVRPYLGISADAEGKRASAVLAWSDSPNSVAVRVVAEVTGTPLDTDRLGRDMKRLALKLGASTAGFDPRTDADLARHLPKTQAIQGREYANASAKFYSLVEGGQVHWDDADPITADIPWTTRKDHEEGTFSAVRSKDDRPITAILAAIRAVWLASGPRQTSGGIW